MPTVGSGLNICSCSVLRLAHAPHDAYTHQRLTRAINVTQTIVFLLAALSSGVRLPWLPSSFYSCFLSSSFSHYILNRQSPAPPILCCCSPFSFRSLQISLNAILPSHFRSSSPPFPSTFWVSPLFANFSSLILPT